MESPQSPFAAPSAPLPEDGRRPVVFASLLWAVFLTVVVLDFLYIRNTRAVFEAMYEGLGNDLPAVSRFFLNPLTHLAALAGMPLLALGAGIAWRLKAKAGIAALIVATLLAAGWGLTYRWAMKLPIEHLEHAFDAD